MQKKNNSKKIQKLIVLMHLVKHSIILKMTRALIFDIFIK